MLAEKEETRGHSNSGRPEEKEEKKPRDRGPTFSSSELPEKESVPHEREERTSITDLRGRFRGKRKGEELSSVSRGPRHARERRGEAP